MKRKEFSNFPVWSTKLPILILAQTTNYVFWEPWVGTRIYEDRE
jgi:hypothetical protein